MNRLLKLVSLAAALAVAPTLASAAGQATGSFTVTANVQAKCSVAANAVTVDYDPFSATATTFTNAVNVTCTKGTSFDTSITSANGWTLNDTSSPSVKIPYAVNQTNAAGADWKTTPFHGVSTTKATPVTQVAFFTIAAGNDYGVGAYTDTISITVNY